MMFKNNTLLITGGTGSFGNAVLNRFLYSDHFNEIRIFSRDEMLIKVWHANDDILDSRTVDTHIKNIRAKLDLSSIISVRGIGYEWFE